MRTTRTFLMVLAAAAVMAFAAQAATAGDGGWFHHTHIVGNADPCDKSSQQHGNDDTVTGPFASKELCDSSGGGGGGGGPVPGWPSDTGSGSGMFTCSPVTLTSTDDKNGYGAIDFGATGGTFQQMGDGGSFSYLAGDGAGGSPRLSVFLANGDLWYVYLYQVNGAPSTPSFEDSTDNPNHYVSWADAMAADGSQAVTDAVLVVDAGWAQEGGTQSIQVEGVFLTNCGGGALPPPPNHMFLCYSKFETDGGMVFTNTQALGLLADPASGYWAPFAVAGTDATGATPNISGYHLVCNPPSSLAPTGTWLYANNDGSAEVALFGPLIAGSAGYEIAK